MSFNPHTPEDRAEMLATAGLASIEEMFAPVPASIRFPELHLPPQLTEMEAAARLQELADRMLAMATRPMALVVDPSLLRPVEVPVLRGDATRLREATGWEPQIPIEQTLSDLLDDQRRLV